VNFTAALGGINSRFVAFLVLGFTAAESAVVLLVELFSSDCSACILLSVPPGTLDADEKQKYRVADWEWEVELC